MRAGESIHRMQALGVARGVAVRFDKTRGKGSHGTLHYGERFTVVKRIDLGGIPLTTLGDFASISLFYPLGIADGHRFSATSERSEALDNIGDYRVAVAQRFEDFLTSEGPRVRKHQAEFGWGGRITNECRVHGSVIIPSADNGAGDAHRCND
jgi:hypothetical protein